MNSKTKKGWLFLAAVVALLVIIGKAIGSDDTAQKIDMAKDRSAMAFVISKGFVKNQLKSPASADFPSLEYTKARQGDSIYIITSYVDAKNGFGADIRNQWATKVKYLGGNDGDPNNWQLVDIELKP